MPGTVSMVRDIFGAGLVSSLVLLDAPEGECTAPAEGAAVWRATPPLQTTA